MSYLRPRHFQTFTFGGGLFPNCQDIDLYHPHFEFMQKVNQKNCTSNVVASCEPNVEINIVCIMCPYNVDTCEMNNYEITIRPVSFNIYKPCILKIVIIIEYNKDLCQHGIVSNSFFL